PVQKPAEDAGRIGEAAKLLAAAKHPGLFVGWGARDAYPQVRAIAERLQAPVATTLQGLSMFPANHPLHAGFGFGPAAVPAAPPRATNGELIELNRREKQAYRQSWYEHRSDGKVNPARFFDELRKQAPDQAITVLDDGNHTFLAAELFPVHAVKSVILPTDFNSMGYAVPAAIGAKLANPDLPVNVIVGDGAFAMSCMEILTAVRNELGIVYYVFHDGELSQIAQFQQLPYNRKTCTELGEFDLEGGAVATGAACVDLPEDAALASAIGQASALAAAGRPVIVDVRIDYSKPTAFTAGAGKTTFLRLPLAQKARILGRALGRRILG